MDKTQAEAIAQAILEPDVRAQEDIQRKRAAEALYMARKRQVAWFMLVGCAIGGVTAHFMGVRFTQGIIWGGITGSALGWFVVWVRGRSRATGNVMALIRARSLTSGLLVSATVVAVALYRLWQAGNLDKLGLIAIAIAGAAFPAIVALIAVFANSRGNKMQ